MSSPRLLAKQNRLTMMRNAVWALSNLCRGKNPPPDFSKVTVAMVTIMPSTLLKLKGVSRHHPLLADWWGRLLPANG